MELLFKEWLSQFPPEVLRSEPEAVVIPDFSWRGVSGEDNKKENVLVRFNHGQLS